jgi:hypothetical protein
VSRVRRRQVESNYWCVGVSFRLVLDESVDVGKLIVLLVGYGLVKGACKV